MPVVEIPLIRPEGSPLPVVTEIPGPVDGNAATQGDASKERSPVAGFYLGGDALDDTRSGEEESGQGESFELQPLRSSGKDIANVYARLSKEIDDYLRQEALTLPVQSEYIRQRYLGIDTSFDPNVPEDVNQLHDIINVVYFEKKFSQKASFQLLSEYERADLVEGAVNSFLEGDLSREEIAREVLKEINSEDVLVLKAIGEEGEEDEEFDSRDLFERQSSSESAFSIRTFAGKEGESDPEDYGLAVQDQDRVEEDEELTDSNLAGSSNEEVRRPAAALEDLSSERDVIDGTRDILDKGIDAYLQQEGFNLSDRQRKLIRWSYTNLNESESFDPNDQEHAGRLHGFINAAYFMETFDQKVNFQRLPIDRRMAFVRDAVESLLKEEGSREEIAETVLRRFNRENALAPDTPRVQFQVQDPPVRRAPRVPDEAAQRPAEARRPRLNKYEILAIVGIVVGIPTLLGIYFGVEASPFGASGNPYRGGSN